MAQPPITGSPGPQPGPSGPPGAPPPAISLSGLQSTLIQINLALTAMTTALEANTAALLNAFPQASASVAATASGGAAVLPAAPEAFLVVQVGVTTYKIPLYGS